MQRDARHHQRDARQLGRRQQLAEHDHADDRRRRRQQRDETVLLRSIEELAGLLDRFLLHGETTTSVINATPVPRRDLPLDVMEQRV